MPSTGDRAESGHRRLVDLAGCTAALLLVALLGGAVVYQLMTQARAAGEARALNLAAFDEAWTLISEEHFDPELGGVDWASVREELRPRMARTRSRLEGREVLKEMLSRLGQSHFAVIAAEALSTESYAGPVAVLIDELCLSGSELFAHGARSLGRAYLVGSTTSRGRSRWTPRPPRSSTTTWRSPAAPRPTRRSTRGPRGR